MNTRTRFLKYLMGRNAQFVEVNSDKMQHRGINKGDLVLVDKSSKPKPGDIGMSERDGKYKFRQVDDGEKDFGGKVVFVVKGV